jgi:hypothetical protein
MRTPKVLQQRLPAKLKALGVYKASIPAPVDYDPASRRKSFARSVLINALIIGFLQER